MISQNTPNTLSRRNWLRDAAITATGAVVLPSLLTGCTDHRIPPVGAIQDVPLTNEQLKAAAQNLLHMEAWMRDLYEYTGNYEDAVFLLLKSGEKPTAWKDFLLSILTDIAVGIVGAALAANPVLAAGLEAVVAIASANISKWALGDKPNNLDAEFAEFKLGHLQMQKAISTMLLILADETDSYRNLREGWKGEIDFNGKKYTLLDLANSHFPTVGQGTAYVALRDAAYKQFKKYIWNVMIVKCGSLKYWYAWHEEKVPTKSPARYASEDFYKIPGHEATYLRGWWESPGSYWFRYWYYEVDGRELSPEAATELFKDDYSEHIINPDGLFNRDYVFKQMNNEREKPDFYGYWDPSNIDVDKKGWDQPHHGLDPESDNYVFTAGEFPQLVKK